MEGPVSFWGHKEKESNLILPEHDDDDDDDEVTTQLCFLFYFKQFEIKQKSCVVIYLKYIFYLIIYASTCIKKCQAGDTVRQSECHATLLCSVVAIDKLHTCAIAQV